MNGINPLSIVKQTTRDIVRQSQDTSFFWEQAFDALHKVHVVWKGIEKLTIYGNIENFHKLLAGHSLQWVAGDNIFVKIAAASVLIATRIMDCVKEELLVLKEVRRLYDACFDTTYLTPNPRWSKPTDYTFLSPSCSYTLRSFLRSFIHQLLRLIGLIIRIVKHLIVLSLKMMSAAESFSLDPEVIKEGTREIFVNLEKCQKLLMENKELLLDFLKEYQTIVEKILDFMGAGYTYNILVSKLESSIREERPSRNEGFSLGNCGYFVFQHMMFGLFQSVNLHRFIPKQWIPPLTIDWVEEEGSYPRFPPKDWVQIHNYKNVIRVWRSKGVQNHAAKSLRFNQL